MQAITLTQEEKDSLKEVMATEGWKSIMRLCTILVDNHARAVLTCRPEELASARARYEGAAQLAVGLQDVRKQLRSKED